MRPSIRILTLATVGSLTVLGLAACTGSTLPSVPTSSPSPSPTIDRLSVSTIAGLALREVGKGTVVSVEDESDGAEWAARVVAADGTVQEVHLAADGAVLAGPSADTTDADDESDNRALVAAASSVSLAAAQKRMLAAVPGGRVTEIELGDLDDRVAWQGDVLDRNGVRHDVRIDAVNSSVLLDRPDAAPSPAPTGGS